MHPASLVSALLAMGLGLTVALGPATATHHHQHGAGAGAGASWEEDPASRTSPPSSSRYRHPLRHHGQDAARGGSSTGLDQLINRLDSMNHLGSPGYDYWRHKGSSSTEQDQDNQIALEELRQAVEDYERGEVLPAVKPHPAPAQRHRTASLKAAPSSTSSREDGDAKRRHRIDALLDDDDDDDDETDVDDKDDDSEETSAEDSDSEEADKGVSQEVDDMMDMDYKDPSSSDMSQVGPTCQCVLPWGWLGIYQ